ncbi:hypothetical protein ES703_83241 [subsurface metagenome]
MTLAKGFTHESAYNESIEWYTPRWIFDALKIDFNLDPCSPGSKIVPWIPADKHLTFADNGLIAHWEGNVWLNPPYGSETPDWLEHLSATGQGIALVFARTDTKWFQDYVPKSDAVCFINGRINFVPNIKAKLYAEKRFDPNKYYVRNARGKRIKKSPGAPSMLVAYGEENAKALFKCGLGLTLPVSKNVETFRMVKDFAGGGHRPHENLPRVSEIGQGLFDTVQN